MNNNIKLKDACIYYNPDTKQVLCVNRNKQETILKGYWNDFGANWTSWKTMSNTSRMLHIFAKATHISIIEKIPLKNFRNAFFDIIEIRSYLATNCL